MIDAQVLMFTIVAAALTVTPGADTMLIVRNVLRGGLNDGLVTTFGICSGLFLHAVLSAVGVSVILMHSATAFHIVKLVGAGYLLWLGVQSLRAALRRERDDRESGRSVVRAAVSARRCFLEGFLSNVLNPKVAVFYLAFLPQFIGPADAVLTKSVLLASIHFVEGIVWLATLSILLDRSRRFFLKSAVRRWLEGICGALLVALGARLALARP